MQVVDEDGVPVEGLKVVGCGDADGPSDASGRVAVQVQAGGGSCELRVHAREEGGSSDEGLMWIGSVEVSELTADETRPVQLVAERLGPMEWIERIRDGKMAGATAQDVQQEMESSSLEASTAGAAEQMVLFEELAESAQGSEAELYGALAQHRRRMADLEEDRAMREELKVMAEEASTPEERQALEEERNAMLKDLIDQIRNGD